MKKYLNNKGLTLVEILCAISIMGIVTTAISSALVVSSRNYQRGVSEINVQQETQFLKNQLSNLIIDATGDVSFKDNLLTIEGGDVDYSIIFEPEKECLYYFENDNTFDLHLLAEGVSVFEVDTSNFKTNRNVSINMILNDGDKNFHSSYTITSRNGMTEEPIIVPTINALNEIVLEPNETFKIEATVIGVDNKELEWKIALNKDKKTTISQDGKIKIGKNETTRTLFVTISTKEKDINGNPKALKVVKVNVRRVTNLSLFGRCTSGIDKKKDSIYTIETSLYGNNLDKMFGNSSDENYVNPYSINWEVNSNAYDLFTIIHKDDNKLMFKLKRDIIPGEKINVRAIASHPNGINKTFINYDDISNKWELKSRIIYLVLNGDDIRRFSDTRQGYFTQEFENLAINELSKKYVYRFREIGSDDWSEWYENTSGDSNDSMDINLRPSITATLDYNKDYQIQIRISIIDSNGKEVWPTSNESEDDYIYGGIMKKVSVLFSSSLLGFEDANSFVDAKEIKAYKGNSFDLFEISKIIGYKENDMRNYLNYILEKKIEGEWKNVSTNDVSIQKGNSCKLKFEKDDFEGEYRIKIYAQDMPIYEFNENNEPIKTSNVEDFILYNEETNEGIFYFKVIK